MLSALSCMAVALFICGSIKLYHTAEKVKPNSIKLFPNPAHYGTHETAKFADVISYVDLYKIFWYTEEAIQNIQDS